MRDPNSTSRHIVVRDLPDGKDAYGDDGKARGEIVSYAMWNFFVTPEEEGAAEEGVGGDSRRDEGGAYHASWPPDAHHDALKALVEMGRKKREDIMGKKKYACKYIFLLIYVSTFTFSSRYREECWPCSCPLAIVFDLSIARGMSSFIFPISKHSLISTYIYPPEIWNLLSLPCSFLSPKSSHLSAPPSPTVEWAQLPN